MLVKNSCRLTHLYTNPSYLRSELLMSDALKKRRCSRACYKENNSPKKEPNQRRHSESLLFRYSDVIWAGRGTKSLNILPVDYDASPAQLRNVIFLFLFMGGVKRF